MTVGMDSSNGGGKFPDYQSQVEVFQGNLFWRIKTIYCGQVKAVCREVNSELVSTNFLTKGLCFARKSNVTGREKYFVFVC